MLACGVLVATSSLLLAPLGCFSKDAGGSDAGPGFGGADAGFGNVSIESLAIVVYALSVDVESLAVAGAVCGPLNRTINCPKGGTVTVTGTSQNCTAAGGSGVENIDFDYTMTGCADEADGITVALTGAAVHSGTLTSTSGALSGQDVTFKATSSVLIVPSQQGAQDDPQSCTFALTYTLASGTLTLSGNICGDPFNASFADR